MISKGRKMVLGVVGVLLVVALVMSACGPAQPAKPTGPYTLRVGTSTEGSRGFTMALAMQKVVSQYADDVKFMGMTTAGSQASVVMLSHGTMEVCWDSAFDLYQVGKYEGRWKDAPLPTDKMPQLGFFITKSLRYLICHEKVQDKVKKLMDVAGLKVGVGQIGSSYYDPDMRIVAAFGLDKIAKVISIDSMQQANALLSGQCDCNFFYGGVGTETLVPHNVEVDTRVPIYIVKYAPEEIAILDKISGYPTGTQPINPKAWSQEVLPKGETMIVGNVSSYGFQFRYDVPEDVAYKVMKITYDHWADILAITPVSTEWGPNNASAKQTNINLITSFVGSPLKLHPGAAKFYKEIGWWQDSWASLVPTPATPAKK